MQACIIYNLHIFLPTRSYDFLKILQFYESLVPIGKQPTRHRDISQGKNSQGRFFVNLSLFIITKKILKSESLILLKLNQLMVAIGKKPALGDHESSLKKLICELSLGRCQLIIQS